ncbi:hypothetical protein F2Q69_00029942 [Brassica cretica]|uniref:Uncharacterized protein n=1 Tax=Brassica cretica TaxID=69181 RepID=A0A8S9RT52_BRACR|nr:hypothetical protein F2Q69_00029942 [Brassica cretica]
MPGNLFLPLPRGRDGFLVHSTVLHRFLGVALGSKEVSAVFSLCLAANSSWAMILTASHDATDSVDRY